MPTTHFSGSRTIVLAVGALTIALLALLLPGATHAAQDQSCYGSLKALPKTADRDTGVSYRFACGGPAKAFVLSNSTRLSYFDVSADVFDPDDQGGAIRGDDRFGECNGAIPGVGFICTGSYAGYSRTVSGSFDTSIDPCARDRHGHLKVRTSITVLNADGTMAGPYGLGKPQGCPKPTPTARKTAGKRRS
jgi:hypothetical protein